MATPPDAGPITYAAHAFGKKYGTMPFHFRRFLHSTDGDVSCFDDYS